MIVELTITFPVITFIDCRTGNHYSPVADIYPMDPLKILEKQSGFLRLLVYLSDKKEKTITEILDETDIPVHQLYASIEKAKELGLVKTRVDDKKYPPRSLVSVTKKGMKVANKITETVEIIGRPVLT